MTHRQFLVWCVWLDLQWNVFDKQSQYLASIACEVRRTILKDPSRATINQMKLVFKEEGEGMSGLDDDSRKKRDSQIMTQVWLARVTSPGSRPPQAPDPEDVRKYGPDLSSAEEKKALREARRREQDEENRRLGYEIPKRV